MYPDSNNDKSFTTARRIKEVYSRVIMSQEEYTENLKVIVAEKLSTLQGFTEDIKYVAEYIVLLMVNGGTVETVVQELLTLFDSVPAESLMDVVQTAFFALEALQQGETVNSIVNKIRGVPEVQSQQMALPAQQQQQQQSQREAQPLSQQHQQLESGEYRQPQQVPSAFSGIVPLANQDNREAPQFTLTGFQPQFDQQRATSNTGRPRGGARGGRGSLRGASRGSHRNNNNSRFNPLAKALGMESDPNSNSSNVHHRKEGRCKVFPRCPLGKTCPHAHPTKVCNDYPNCPKPAGTCEYLHPNQDEDLMREIERTRDEFQQRKAAILAARSKPIRTGIVLCKFGHLCTNPMCPFGHPTPANEDAKVIDLVWCPDNLNCTDPNCKRAHSSISKIKQVQPMGKAKNIATSGESYCSKPMGKPIEKSLEQCKFGAHCTNKRCKYRHARSHIMCREGANCTRIDCLFGHPINEDCKFGVACRNAYCLFRHPEGRVLPEKKYDASSNANSTSTSERVFAMPESAAIEPVADQNRGEQLFAATNSQQVDHDTDMA